MLTRCGVRYRDGMGVRIDLASERLNIDPPSGPFQSSHPRADPSDWDNAVGGKETPVGSFTVATMDSRPSAVLDISGSLRRGAHNAAALRVAG